MGLDLRRICRAFADSVVSMAAIGVCDCSTSQNTQFLFGMFFRRRLIPTLQSSMNDIATQETMRF
jgi:hypothetical protein